MPWKATDALGHTKKADTPKKQETWAKVANAALKRCLAQDRGQEECKSSAIRQANTVIGNVKESGMAYRGYFTSGSATVEVRAIELDGEPVSVGELVAAYQEQRGQGQGVDGPRQGDGGADVCVCPKCGHEEPHEKSTPCNETKCPKCGAAMTGKQEEMAEPSKANVAEVRGLLEQALDILREQDDEEEVAEAQLSESASGHALTLAEAQAVTGGPRAPLLMDFALINPGRGNRKDNHYYPREVLERDAHVFEGVKMYATDHRQEEKSVRTEVGVVEVCPLRFEEDGTPIGRASIFNPDFAEQVRNRAKAGHLDSLENSILGTGKTKKGKTPDGEKANIVEAITKGISVDFVTRGGAGGQARALIENDGGEIMSEQDKEKDEKAEEASPQEAQTGEAVLAEKEQAQQEEAPQQLAETEVQEAVDATKLPEFAKTALKVQEYEDKAALKKAIEEAVKEVARLTGAGQPFGQGGSTAPGEQPMSEADYETAYAKILTRHGVYVPEEAK